MNMKTYCKYYHTDNPDFYFLEIHSQMDFKDFYHDLPTVDTLINCTLISKEDFMVHKIRGTFDIGEQELSLGSGVVPMIVGYAKMQSFKDDLDK